MAELKHDKKILYADDTKESVSLLIRLRLPWLLIGLVGGALASIIVSKFEKTLSGNIQLAFFLPVIVYMSDAVGTQTETIFVRNLAKGKPHFLIYLVKEFLVGIFLGVILGVVIGFFAKLWLGSNEIAFTVGLAMFINIAVAPIIALVVPEILFKERRDPALGAGPLKTVIQDIISIVIYLFIASLVLFA